MRRGERKLVEAAVERLRRLAKPPMTLQEYAAELSRLADDLAKQRVGAKDWAPKDWKRK